MSRHVVETARAVFSGQRAVRLEPGALPALCAQAPEAGATPQTAPQTASQTTDDRGTALALLFGPVNHCFFTAQGEPYRPHGAAPGGSAALRRAMAEAAVDWTDLRAVADLPIGRWRTLVGGPLYDTDGRHARLTGFARHLLARGLDRTTDALAAMPTAETLLLGLVDSGVFADPFLKRAQSTVFDVSQLAEARTGRHLDGIEELTLLADYRLIQLFLHAGVIVVESAALNRRILERRPLAADAPETLALRAAVVLCGGFLEGGFPALWDKRLWSLAKRLEADGALRVPPVLVLTDQF